MAAFLFPPPDPDAWATWNLSFESGSNAADRNLDKAALEKSISDFTVGPDSAGITCAPQFNWRDIDGSHSQLNVNLSCKNPDGSGIAKRIVVRPPGGTKPPPSKVSQIELVVRS